ncbi:transcriptional regulator [Allgaiera indica]|uniref:AraC-type DNA-binding protein n=1 Tax=Allgaiera indica TaxID=765699 RepID=A0AAN4UQL3_9RHOB|nr:AraC family transcriptional regulator [Allgaiera indica]GHE01328.1 transcriptional regulator [Allgaiera indica]SDW84817.1 AraC-type DNA-binding protein [Allgaiera indica]
MHDRANNPPTAATPSADGAPADPAPAQLRMIPIPRLAAHGRWRVEAMRSLNEPMLLWFTRGQGRITVSGVTRGYGPHNAIFLPAGVMHGFDVSSHVFGTAVFFGAARGLPLPETPLHLRIRDQQPQAELTGILDNIHRELEGGRPGYDRAAGHHLGLLGVWIERQVAAQDGAPAPDAAARLVARFTALVERDFRSGLGVADYAAALGVTPTHLTRVCRQCCGRSAHEIVQDRVLFEARKLLKETDLPVGEVSRALGFTTAAYFTRAFQNAVGKTPSAFRRGA